MPASRRDRPLPLVQEHLETFLPKSSWRPGRGLPEFVKEEFDAFLECGIVAHGFLRLRCVDCAHEKLVAFGCKRRGFCPSCGTRRMAETAARLIDHVIPRVPVRQWVLSFAIPFACCLLHIGSCSRPSCRSSTGSLPHF
jgi:ribosomal protein S27E